MRHEPIEFGLAATSTRVREVRPGALSARGARYFARAIAGAPATEVVDEAFAGFPQAGPQAIDAALVAKLSAQLKALDQQRDQLSQLLRSIDADSIAQ